MIIASTAQSQEAGTAPAEPIIDIHQHTHYAARTNAQLIAHQKTMGVTHTILLPAGSPAIRLSTHYGKSNGLAVNIGGVESAMALSKQHPGQYSFFANEVPDLAGATGEIDRYLKLGAKGIGEQKFNLDADSSEMHSLAEVAQSYRVPILIHFQHEMYNKNYASFEKVLKKFPKVNFIGHAQTFWANIDKNHVDQSVLYPRTKVTPGGLTDRYLSEYPNMFADISAGSGLNSMLRDEDHARGFLDRHQDKIMFGSDCNDTAGQGEKCQGAQIIAAIRRLAPSKGAERKMLYGNAKRMLGIQS
jgi:predicted TIM-barrel fold metal-dependent hydrolase